MASRSDEGRIVVAGAGGRLGGAFVRRLAGSTVHCLGRTELDVTAPAALLERVRSLRPAMLINCAADTDVEGSEVAPDRAYRTNALLPELLAQACRRVGARLVHFSSTGCYGTAKQQPYLDFDPLQPTTVHHASKAAGEDAVRASGAECLVLRVGWLFGGGAVRRGNFVWDRIVEARTKREMHSDPSQVGTPTWVDDVVTQTLALLAAGVTGTFNCVSLGAATRLDYVARILALAGIDTTLVPRRFERRAPVSPNEAARNYKLDLLGLNRMPTWEAALARYVPILLAEEKAGTIEG